MIITKLKTSSKLSQDGSPVLISELSQASRFRNKTNSLLLLHKKSKSLYSVPSNCSTPKVHIDKELEHLNALYETGALNETKTHNTNSPKLTSPIIKSSISHLSNITLCNDLIDLNTPKIENTTSCLSNGECLENISRKIKFDEDVTVDAIQKETIVKIFGKKLETVEEDEELLDHLTEIENKNTRNVALNESIKEMILENRIENKGSSVIISGFQTASGKNLAFNKEKIIKDITDQLEEVKPILGQDQVEILNKGSNLIMSGFQTASGRNLLFKKDKIIRDIANNDLEIQNTINNKATADEPIVSLSGFQTANGKNLAFKKDKIIKDIIDKNDEMNIPIDKHQFQEIDSNLKNVSNLAISGFQTASGKNLAFKKDKIIKDNADQEKIESLNLSKGADVSVSGFQTASGRNLLFKKDKILIDNLEHDEEMKSPCEEISELIEPEVESKIVSLIKPEKPTPQIIQKTVINPGSRMNDGKKFKKPKLMDKSKLNKYVDSSLDTSTINTGASFNAIKTDISVDLSIDQAMDQTQTNTENLEFKNESKHLNHHFLKPILKSQFSYLKIKDLKFVKTSTESSKFIPQTLEPSSMIENSFAGFSTASGKKIELSDKAKDYIIQKKDELLNDNSEGREIVKNEFYLVKPIFEIIKCEEMYFYF